MNAGNTIYSNAAAGDTLGGRLSWAREAAGFTLSQLAQSIGVRKETLSAWEQDRSEPRANRLVMLAGMLNISPAWLLSGMGEAPQGNGVSASMREVLAEIERVKGIQQQADSAISNLQEMVEKLAAEEAVQRLA